MAESESQFHKVQPGAEENVAPNAARAAALAAGGHALDKVGAYMHLFLRQFEFTKEDTVTQVASSQMKFPC